MLDQVATAWWAVARSEEVTGKKPFSADIAEQPLVLWRDKAGIARALEDRCPHRRAPLSRGCIRDNGWIQCGYHGWSYDGESGRLLEIPNMKNEQRFPPLYKAQSFSVAESGGFVRVSLSDKAPAPVMSSVAMPISGTSLVGLAQDQYINALFDNPGLLIGIRGVSFTPYLASELRIEDGRLVMERNCQWKGTHWPAPFSSDFPISLLTRTDPVTGETELMLRDPSLQDLLTAIIAPVPAARGVTAIRWRASLGPKLSGVRAKLLGVGKPLHVYENIDAEELRKLMPSASLHGEDLRAAMTQAGQPAAA
jgi:nitrite reductase/ring-hydroxylating ferredoxin subunit